jgi:hypothetical protein
VEEVVMGRFKIDCRGTYNFPYELYRLDPQGGLWWTRHDWKFIGCYATIEEARAHYEKIKDLPEYLE